MPLSTKQMEYLALAWQCFESEPKINFEKFAKVANLASANSARELMRVTKKKLKDEYGNDDDGSTPKATPSKRATSSTPKSAAGSKRGRPGKKSQAELNGHQDDDDVEPSPSPTKKARKSPVKKTNGIVKAESVEEDDEDGDLS